MQTIEIIGWVSIGLVGVFGLIVTLTIIAQFLGVEFRTFVYKIDRAVEIRKEDIKAKAEAKKERMAKLRAISEDEKNLKLANTIDKIKSKKEAKRLRKQEYIEEPESEYQVEEAVEELEVTDEN